MAISPFIAAIQQLAIEKNIPEDRVFETVEAALAAAYRKDFGKPDQIIKVVMDREKGGFEIYQVLEVLDDPELLTEKDRQIMLEDAVAFDSKIKAGEELLIPLPHQEEFGRIAAQTAKQVIVQKIREAEREILFDEFKQKENKLLNGSVQQLEGDSVVVSLGKVNAIMPPKEQIRGEYYTTGQRIRVFVKEVAESGRGPQIIVSRSDARFIEALFALEVPEIQSETVEIKAIAREAGSRTKIAVFSENDAIDPVGSCVGQRGTRVQAVLNEIGEEKIDIILYDLDPKTFILNALSPAKIRNLKLDEENKNVQVEVDTDQLSLAIGRNGQNVRLASKLTGYSIDILRDEPTSDEEVSAEAEDSNHSEDTQMLESKPDSASKEAAPKKKSRQKSVKS